MEYSHLTQIERRGVRKIEEIFDEIFGWIPREVLKIDLGIDMHIEITEQDNSSETVFGKPVKSVALFKRNGINKKNATGRFISVQIKSGNSYFTERKGNHVVFRTDKEHWDYWLNYSTPVIIALFNPDMNSVIWKDVNKNDVVFTKKKGKLLIPEDNFLDESSIDKILNIPTDASEVRLFKKVLSDEKLMLITQGSDSSLLMEVEHWVAKSSGKASIQLFKNDYILPIYENMIFFFKGEKDLRSIFPWADFEIDESEYEKIDKENFLEQHGIWDSEDKVLRLIDLNDDDDDDYFQWRSDRPLIRPLEEGGEVETYRLRMTLNEVGKAMLQIIYFCKYGIKTIKLEDKN